MDKKYIPWWHMSNIGGGVSFCDEYQAVYDALVLADDAPTASAAAAQNTMVSTLVDLGIWDELDVFQWYSQYSNSGSGALINMINPGTYDATLVNAPTFTSLQGFTGNGSTSSIDSNYSPLTGVNFLRDDCSMFVYARSTLNGALCGVEASSIYTQIRGEYTLMNAFAESVTEYAASDFGLLAFDRKLSTEAVLYKNGVSHIVYTDESNGNPPAIDITVGARNDNGTIKDFSTTPIGCFGAGGSLTPNQHLNLFSAIETCLANQ